MAHSLYPPIVSSIDKEDVWAPRTDLMSLGNPYPLCGLASHLAWIKGPGPQQKH